MIPWLLDQIVPTFSDYCWDYLREQPGGSSLYVFLIENILIYKIVLVITL